MKKPKVSCNQQQALKTSINSAYVYEIRVDGIVRYIGKGRNGRVHSHLIEAKRTAMRAGVKVRNLYPFFRMKLVEAVKRGSTIEEKIIASGLSDQEAYRIEHHAIGQFHKNHPGRLWNTVDERFMDAQYLPEEWLNPVNPLYKLPRPLRTVIDRSTDTEPPIYFGQVPLARRLSTK
jgi:hypothetical protein